MPPHKQPRGRAPSQPPSQPQPSDYETDAPPAAVHVPRPPPRSNEELNLSVLRRVYPDLRAIEHVTPYAALYTFNLETQQWEKGGVEGSLFLCQLAPSPIGAERYCALIYNRLGLDNFYQELTSSDEMEITDPYVILQGDLVYGIWIFADPPPATTANCRVETAEKMMAIAARAQSSREAKEREGGNGDKEAIEAAKASSAPMGRQLSLRQLFGQPDPYQQQDYPPPAQPDVLGQLFMKAKQDYNGHG